MSNGQVTAKIVEEISPIKKKIEVEVPPEWIGEELSKAYKEIGKKAKIKGFRPGKVPREILEKHYESEANEQTIRQLVERAYPEAVRTLGIIPVSYPQISVTKFVPKETVSFEATVETKPEVGEVKGHQGLKLTKTKLEANDEEMDQRLKAIQESLARLVPVEEKKTPKKGDVIFINYEALLEGKAFKGNKVDNYQVELGASRLLPEFEEEILKMKVGENKTIQATLPEDYSDKKFAGKKMTYNVSLQEVKKKVIPEADDELAKSMGEYQTIQEVKDKIREDILKSKEAVEKTKLKKQVIEKLLKKNKFDLPEGMVQAELDSMFRNFTEHLQSQGVSLEQAGVNQEDFFTKNKEEARLRIYGMLFFEAIAKAEGMSVTDEELNKKLEEIAKASHQPLANVQKYYQDNNMMGYLQAVLGEEKTLDFVLTNAKIKEE